MLDFLSSPVLFPSDMDSPKLSAGATFKLPETVNWADYDDYNTMVDKSMTSLTDLTRLEPVDENNNMQVYAPFILPDDTKFNTGGGTAAYLAKMGGGDHSKHMALLGLAQSMVQAYSIPFYSSSLPHMNDDGGDGDDDEQQRKILRANLRGALDVVEHDMQKNGQASLYSGTEQQYNNVFLHNNCMDGQWSWQEEIAFDVPDLVHSACSSPSTHSLVDDHHHLSTPVLLESGISSFIVENNDMTNQQQQQILENPTTETTSALDTPSPLLPSPSQYVDHKKTPSRPIKKWMNKIKQASSTMKQDCSKSISTASRKLCLWIKK